MPTEYINKNNVYKGKKIVIEGGDCLSQKDYFDLWTAMDDIKSGKVKSTPEIRDAFAKQNKIGKYREWEFDIIRYAQLSKELSDEQHNTRVAASTGVRVGFRGSYTQGKNQLKAERAKLIHQLNNE